MLMISILFYTPFSVGQADFMPVLENMGFFLIFLVPIMTMRILAEDRKNGTEVLLLTSPTSLTQIIMGKFIAMYFVFFTITANGFLRYMVRNLVGTIVDVGLSKTTFDEFRKILEAKNRDLAGATAPPHGLFLVNVSYE